MCRFPRLPLALLPCGLLSVGCPDFTLVGDPGGDGAPTAVVVATPGAAGQAPFELVLDASGSTPFADGGALEFEFDVDGDGTFEVARSGNATFATRYDAGGTFEAAVRVRGEDGRFDVDAVTIEVSPKNPARTADVDVDSDADGVISGADEAVEDERVAPFLANVDDDNRDGSRDRQDSPLNADDDDMAELIVRRVKGLDGARVFIEVSPRIARDRVRLWAGDTAIIDTGIDRAEVPGVDSDDVTLRLEAQTGRTADWDGAVTVRVTVESGDAVVSEDSARLRAAPVIFPDNLQTPRRLFVMKVDAGEDNNRALIDALQTLPDGVELYTTDDDTYFFDRWMQDNWEVGSQTVPGKDGVKEMITALQLARDYGGNLEVSPQTALHPFGRMLFGGGSTTLSGANNPDTMNNEQVSFLNAQEIQGPALELSSEWLAVGHIDEYLQFIPDLSPVGPHPFKVVIASPAMARDVLLGLRERGLGSSVMFSGRSQTYTVDQVLDAEQFNALNEQAQARIDAMQQRLIDTLGLSVDDFRPVPVLYNEVDSGLVASFNPGINNLVTVGDRVFVPDPEGPVVDGQDVWQQATLASLADTDLDIIFVDVFQSYHELLGEAHCGTNLERTPYARAWWSAQ